MYEAVPTNGANVEVKPTRDHIPFNRITDKTFATTCEICDILANLEQNLFGQESGETKKIDSDYRCMEEQLLAINDGVCLIMDKVVRIRNGLLEG